MERPWWRRKEENRTVGAASNCRCLVSIRARITTLSAEGRGQFETHQVPALNFADVLELSRPTVITCDVEGAELDLMDTILPSSVWFVCVEVHLVWLGERGIQQFFEKMHRQGFAYHPRGSAGGIVCFKRLAENAEA